MNSLVLAYDPRSSGVAESELALYERKLAPEIERLAHDRSTRYTTEYSSINVPHDTAMCEHIKQLIQRKKEELNIKVVVVIGIGGSSLGALAVHEALQGVLYNERQPAIKLFFVDSVDSDYVQGVIECIQHECSRGADVLVNVVTKSGTTTETIVNFQIFVALVRKYWPQEWRKRIVVTTDNDSPLYHYAQQERLDTLIVPQLVGGRYSVFSAVGLFPLGCVGIDIDELVAGAQGMVEECVSWSLKRNMAALSAALIHAQFQSGCVIHDTFIFSHDLYACGQWYRQLMGESLGKELDRSGVAVHTGITPTVSLGSNDLHSVTQLYLAGPRDKFTTFVKVAQDTISLSVPYDEQLNGIVHHVQGKTMTEIMDAVFRGVENAYRVVNRPFVTIELPHKSAFFVGQFLQMKMMEMMYLGFLLNVNPFDQPHVELYKKETRAILAR
jgi:glucose-6-phosphate isomerase